VHIRFAKPDIKKDTPIQKCYTWKPLIPSQTLFHGAIYLGLRETATWPVRIDLGFWVHCRGSAWMGSPASLLMPLRAPTIPACSEQNVKWPCPHTFPYPGLPHRHRGVVTRQAAGREGIPGWASAPIQTVR